jgi:hypothetical protein
MRNNGSFSIFHDKVLIILGKLSQARIRLPLFQTSKEVVLQYCLE